MDWNGNQNGYIPDVFGLWLELELEWDLNTRERIGIGAFPFPSGIRMGMGLASTKWLEWESLIPIPILSALAWAGKVAVIGALLFIHSKKFLNCFQKARLKLPSNMGDYRGKLRRGNAIEEYLHEKGVICLHAFSDLSHISPATFVYLLKECYICGTHKATRKFRVLQQQVSRALYNGPQPGPFTFIIQCLYVVSLLGPSHADGFGHMLISSLRNIRSLKSILEDFAEAKHLVVQLFLNNFACAITHDESILVKLLEEFDVELKDIGDAISGSELNNGCLDQAEAYAKQFIFGLIESKSYMAAVKLSERFSIHLSGESFLVKMIQCNQFGTAERWATFMGKPMICLLVQKYLDMNLLMLAYDLVKGNNLMQQFPDVSHLYKESSVRKLAERGCWDVAEQRANNDRELLEFLVYLAMEAGYMEKVDELRERYHLDGFSKVVSGKHV
ncbi:hypothetical protein COCNU_16G004130 [Cocos nucifera]|uniref:Uncharacterized protein n=1 Tax=Cocos nucifera TaxID=13894 RepID=A0A8K0IYH5_COCNU|nr:hypothetical protein COCNU_16G004130 [Cocos nucifera]